MKLEGCILHLQRLSQGNFVVQNKKKKNHTLFLFKIERKVAFFQEKIDFFS